MAHTTSKLWAGQSSSCSLVSEEYRPHEFINHGLEPSDGRAFHVEPENALASRLLIAVGSPRFTSSQHRQYCSRPQVPGGLAPAMVEATIERGITFHSGSSRFEIVGVERGHQASASAVPVNGLGVHVAQLGGVGEWTHYPEAPI